MDWWSLWRFRGTFSSSLMVLANNFCAPVYVIRYWIDVLCSPMDLSPKRSGIDAIYGSGLIGFAILIAFTSTTLRPILCFISSPAEKVQKNLLHTITLPPPGYCDTLQ
jgi:hypothetical protein